MVTEGGLSRIPHSHRGPGCRERPPYVSWPAPPVPRLGLRPLETQSEFHLHSHRLGISG